MPVVVEFPASVTSCKLGVYEEVPVTAPVNEPVKEPVISEAATVESFVIVPTEMLGVPERPVASPVSEPVNEPVRCVSDTEQEFNRVDEVKGA